MPRKPPIADEATADDDEPAEVEPPAEAGEQSDKEPAEVTAEKPEDEAGAPDTESAPETADDGVNGSESSNGGLRNRRQSGKMSLRRRKRSRGGVAVDD